MIKINLLTVDREKPKRRTRAIGLSLGQRLTLACSVILVVTAVGIVWWFWWLQQTNRRLDRDIAAAEQETLRLREVLAQVQKFETQRTQLQQRVALIEELRKGQSGPVHMLDQISRALPERLWLTQIRDNPKEGNTSIEGLTTSLTAVSDFAANLEASGYFKRPVEIVSSQLEIQQKAELVRFALAATFVVPGAPPAAPAGPTNPVAAGRGVAPGRVGAPGSPR
jgi:type IV pilus assembly protein PilN